ncbi:RtcB family protein [Blautia producta]|uniref:RtcB family protein n=1 Tax=Blautia producta TaxID=33035 RepID=UPI0031B5A07C
MKTVNGVYTSAKIFTDTIEDYALAQIQMLCDNQAFEGCQVRIMPDVHPGKVGTIGFTSTVGKRVLPSVVGVDIGCGITIVRLKQKKAEFQKLDTVIRENVPSGFHVRKKPHRFYHRTELDELKCSRHVNANKAALSLGTLGGGNHFIEIDRDEDGNLYAAVHSGSRHLGQEITEYYLRAGQEELKRKQIQIPYELTWLEGRLMEEYISDLAVAEQFAELNRDAILDEIVKGMKWKAMETWSSVHNYIDTSGSQRILRKGAVSAKQDEKAAIPVNMRDGILLGIGLGNQDWNFSAPHGAGRIMKREDIKQCFTVSQFKSEMKGIYCTCIGKGTLDEAPFAYRDLEEITEKITDTVQADKIIRPVYCFKADGRK